MKKIYTLIIILASSLLYASDFTSILQDSTIRPGFCVILGCEKAESLISAQLNGKYLVQGLCTNPETADKIRKELIAKDLYGEISVSLLASKKLPYTDNLANVVVVMNQGSISREEIMRVVAPYGIAIFKENGQWSKITKPYPQEMDEWPHVRHDAANTTVSKDAIVAPPTRLQWLANEKHDREDLTELLSANGRNFYIFRTGKIVARDAFNGIKLWEQLNGGNPWAATENYLCTIIGSRLTTIDAATGKLNKTEAKLTAIPALENGIIYTAHQAYNLEKNEFIWQNPEPKKVAGAPLVADGKIIIATSPRYPNPEIICRDAKTGKDIWRIPAIGAPSVCYRGKLLLRGKQKTEKIMARGKERTTHKAVNHCLDMKDGKKLWTIEFYLPTHHGASSMFCIGDTVWVRPGKLGGRFGADEFWRSYNLQTGEIIKELPAIQSMHRCFEPRATERFIIGTGIDYLDHINEKTYFFHGARGDCGLGATPANGQLYQFPNMCMCMGQVDGVSSVSSHSLTDPAESELKLSDILVKGPAYDKMKSSSGNLPESTKNWTTLRGNNARGGSNKATIPDNLKLLWKNPNTTTPSSPVADSDRVYIALRDKYTISAFATSDGKLKWTFTADGPIDSPPTIAGNSIVFGSEDGWVYVLRATDGKLSWKFKAAPQKRIILSDKYPASTWALHGSLLVENGIIYAIAGHHNELDGGLFAYALELETGKIIWQKRLIRGGLTQEIEMSEVGDTGNSILASDGETLYTELLYLDNQTGKITKTWKVGKLFFCGGFSDKVVWGGPHGYLTDLSLPTYTSGHSSSDWIWGKVRANMIAIDGQYGYGIITLHGRDIKYRKKRQLFKDGPAVIFCAKQQETNKDWHEYITDDSLVWKLTLPEDTISRSIIKTANKVIVACQTTKEDGSKAGLILQLDPVTGKEKSRIEIASPPRWDGLSAAGNHLYLITEDNMLHCLGTPRER